jgi:hypothetical protein
MRKPASRGGRPLGKASRIESDAELIARCESEVDEAVAIEVRRNDPAGVRWVGSGLDLVAVLSALVEATPFQVLQLTASVIALRSKRRTCPRW